MGRISLGTGFLILLVLVTPLISSERVPDPGLLPRFAYLTIICLAGVLVVLLIPKKRKRVDVFAQPIVLLLATYLLYSVFRISGFYFTGDSIFVWIKEAVSVILLLLFIHTIDFNTFKKQLPVAMTLLAGLLVAWGIAELLTAMQTGDFQIPNTTYKITGPFEHRNLFAQVLLLTLPFQYYLLITTEKFPLWIFTFVLSTLSLSLLVILTNRAVWLAGGVSLLMFLFFAFLNVKKKKQQQLTGNITIFLASFLIVIIVSLVFLRRFESGEEFTRHTSEIVETGSGTASDRLELWKRTLWLAKEKPVFGIGISNWKYEISKFDHEGLLSEDNVTFYQRPHNDYLWVLSERGAVGLLILLVFFGHLLLTLLRAVLREQDFRTKLILLATLSAVSAYLVFSFFSFPSERIYHQVLLMFFVAGAVIYRSESPTQKVSGHSKLATGLIWSIGILILLASGYIALKRLQGEFFLKQALEAKAQDNNEFLIEWIDQAESACYKVSPTSTPLAWYRGFGYYQMDDVAEAYDQFLRAYKINPYHIHVLNNLGSCCFRLEQFDDAIKYYREALKMAPNFDESWFNLCAVYFNMQNYQEAYNALIRVNLHTTDSRYQPFIKSVLTKMIAEELNRLGVDEDVQLPPENSWYFEVFKRMRNEGESLKKLIFELEIVTQTIDLQ